MSSPSNSAIWPSFNTLVQSWTRVFRALETILIKIFDFSELFERNIKLQVLNQLCHTLTVCRYLFINNEQEFEKLYFWCWQGVHYWWTETKSLHSFKMKCVCGGEIGSLCGVIAWSESPDWPPGLTILISYSLWLQPLRTDHYGNISPTDVTSLQSTVSFSKDFLLQI